MPTTREELRPTLVALDDELRVPGAEDLLAAQMAARLMAASDNLQNPKEPGFEAPEDFKNVRIWEEVRKAGIISAQKQADLEQYVGKDLLELINYPGEHENSAALAILRTPGVGRKTLHEVGVFLAANYGVAMPGFAQQQSEVGDVSPVVTEFESDLDTFIHDKIDFDAAGISAAIQARFIEAGVVTVGDFLAASNVVLEQDHNVKAPQIRKVRDYVTEKYKFLKTYVAGSLALVVRAKVASAKKEQ